MLDILNRSHRPDILDCLANLSSDEVFTPPSVVNEMLDLLPKEVWGNKDYKFLDPAVKSGVFLREIVIRLMAGLSDVIPNEDERRAHIFGNMVYGIAITELTGLIGRRSLYCCKDASNKEHSVHVFDHPDGNIYYERCEHDYQNDSCSVCGSRSDTYERGDELENYAYPFLHKDLKEIFDMKFDVIIGNPPYQLKDGGNGASALPIYHHFVNLARDLEPKYISMITPSRWFAGGKGLDAFRESMLNDDRISHIVDYVNASQCFPGVEIKGGVNYFLWDKNYSGDCYIKNMDSNEDSTVFLPRSLSSFDVFIRHNKSVSILNKVLLKKEPSLSAHVSSRKPYGLPTNFSNFCENVDDAVKIYARGRESYTKNSNIVNFHSGFKYWKVLIGRAYGGGNSGPHQVTGVPLISEPNSACTETYLIVKWFEDKDQADNFLVYAKTRLYRFLISLKKNTQDLTKDRFEFVPDLDMSETWTDEKLYARYGLDKDEINFIESMIKEMK